MSTQRMAAASIRRMQLMQTIMCTRRTQTIFAPDDNCAKNEKKKTNERAQ